MRTSDEFDAFYLTGRDPWGIGRRSMRDRVLLTRLRPIVTGKSVLELGCGEGHLSETVFCYASRLTGIDISQVAIERARERKLRNARFEISDFTSLSFAGYDVIAALECLYYLSSDEQDEVLRRISREHSGKPLILSGPIIGHTRYREYFTHEGLMHRFAHHGFSLLSFFNLNVHRRDTRTTLATAIARINKAALDYFPDNFIYQRCYVLRA